MKARPDAVRQRLVFDADRDGGGPFPNDLVGDVGGERQAAAQVLRHQAAVHPHLGGVVRGAHAQEDPLPAPGRRDPGLRTVPGEPQVVARVVEQIVPAAGNHDRSRGGQGVEPSGGLAFVFRVELELPEARKVQKAAVLVLAWAEQSATRGAGDGRGSRRAVRPVRLRGDGARPQRGGGRVPRTSMPQENGAS